MMIKGPKGIIEKVAIMRILNHNTKRLVNDFKNILEK